MMEGSVRHKELFFKSLLTAKSDSDISQLISSYGDSINTIFRKETTAAINAQCECVYFESLQGLNNHDTLVLLESLMCGNRCPHIPLPGRLSNADPITIGVYPIHVAAATGNIKLIEELMAEGANINSETLFDQMSVFEMAINCNQTASAEWIVQCKSFKPMSSNHQCMLNGCKVESCQRLFSLMRQCVRQGEWRHASLCFSAGLPLCQEYLQSLFLFDALKRSNCALLRWYLTLLPLFGTDINTIRNVDHLSVLDLAKTRAIADMLMDAGADPSLPNTKEDRSGHHCYALTNQLSKRRLDVAEALLIRYPDIIDNREPFECTALQGCAMEGFLQGIQLCHRYGADHNVVSLDGRSALSYSLYIEWRGEECAEYLLKLGADANQVDDNGNTALIYATYHGNPRTVESLLRNGADPSAMNELDVTPLWNSVHCQSLKCVKQLLKSNADPNQASIGQNIFCGVQIYDEPVSPLFVAVRLENVSIIRSLVAAGCNVNKEKFRTPNFEMYVENWTGENKRWLEELSSSPHTLQWWCKRLIRQSLPTNGLHNIDKFLITSLLKHYLQDV